MKPKITLWNLYKLPLKKSTVTHVLTSITMAILVAAIIASETLFEYFSGSRTLFPIILANLGIVICFQPLSKQIGHLVEHSFFRREHKSEMTVSSFSQSVLSTLNKDILLHSIEQTIVEISGPEKMLIMLLDPKRKRYVPELAVGISNHVTKKTDFSLKHPLAQRLIQSRRGLLKEDLQEEPELKRCFEEKEAVFFLPLIYKDELLGVVSLGEKKSGEDYGEEEIGLFFTLAVRTSLALANINLYEERTKSLFDGIRSLAEAIEAKDAYTRGHCERVSKIATAIGVKLNLAEKEVENIKITGLLHDIGKIGVNEEILNKTGSLSREEFAHIKLHPVIGAKIIESIPFNRQVFEGIYYHHERYDGQGYPDGLSNGDIPLVARILSVADAYEAMTSNRAYRPSLPEEKVLSELQLGSHKQFDSKIVEVFLQIKDQIR